MKFGKKFVCNVFVAGICGLSVLSGCASKEKSSDTRQDAAITEDEQEKQEVPDASDVSESTGLGEFSIEDINGETYTQEMFADSDLTMINVFTTWCTPCINEIPDLGKLYEEMADQGVQIVGIALDAIGQSGSPDEETVEKARLLAEKTGVTYPFLIPDAGYLNGRLAYINAVPETFFVDKDGNFVGETYSGSRSFEEWKGIVEKELEGVTR